MFNFDVSIFRCPETGLPLDRHGDFLQTAEGRRYPIESGIPNFVQGAELSAIEQKTKEEYDRVAEDIYDVAVDWQFAALYEDETATRNGMIDMLRVGESAKVLEVGCGTARDSILLAQRLGASGLLHMQDLSAKMVERCASKMAALSPRPTCKLEYSVSNAMKLPFEDGTFDAVFHFGGFNQFEELQKGASELSRVVKRGGRVVIGDEAVAPWLKGSEFEAIVTTNNPLFRADVPLHALPTHARDVEVRWIVGNCFYVMAFSKGDGPPPLNLDLAHRGWRGGTMRTRYYGVLEGVRVETKALVRDAAARAGLSVHEWLDRVVSAAAQEKEEP